ncbi:MAG TPA: alpha-amylase family glycosyl hydrolase [Chloroflexia bacterium]|nr:alpha-amylase family glycosyl hydrolase [Chloroflexia bacterium]
MNRSKKLSSLTLVWLVALSLLLGACGGEATATPAATTSAPTTVAAVTTAAPTTAATQAVATTTVAQAVATTTVAQAATGTATAAVKTSTTAFAPPPPNLSAQWVKDGVCYEVFVRSFFDSNGDGKGDIPGLISKLDYLNDGDPHSNKSLGVNCLWLMPITASPSYHGYDTTDYFKVNPDYGTNDDFKKLVVEAHKRGIQIITDLVLNHTSKDHPWFKEAMANPQSPYRNYYIFSPTDPGYRGADGQKVWFKNPAGNDYYYAQFGADLPDLNYRNPAVTKDMEEVTRFWLQDMGVDGFRLDAVKHLIEDGQKQVDTPETHDWLRDFEKFTNSVKPANFTIGEVFTPTSLRNFYPDQLNEYFEFSLASSLIANANNGRSSFVGLVKDANNNWPAQRYGSFLSNHDQTRVMSRLSGDTAKMKMAATAYLTLPGLPFIYYGEEIGMQGTKDLNGQGDIPQRTPLQWTADPSNAGFSTGTPWTRISSESKGVSVQDQDANPDSLLNLYRKLVQLRRTNPALSEGDFQPLSGSSSVASYLRHFGDSDILVLINMSDEAVTDLKLSVDSSSLAPGTYTPGELLTVNTAKGTYAPLTVKEGGAITDYAPLASLPAHTAYILNLKK